LCARPRAPRTPFAFSFEDDPPQEPLGPPRIEGTTVSPRARKLETVSVQPSVEVGTLRWLSSMSATARPGSVRHVLVRVLVPAVVVAAAFASAAAADTAGSGFECGGDRWLVKTLIDDAVLNPARRTTVHDLVSRHVPKVRSNTPRLPFEFNAFTVVARVTKIIPEPDGDLHVLLRSGRDQMIAEVPQDDCTIGAPPLYRNAMALARSFVRVCLRARLTGVAFFDILNEDQPGVAPNAIELHPLLGFHCLAG
jgi:hypothetical protein